MNALAPQIEELRQRLAHDSVQETGSRDSATVYRDVLGFVPPCAAGSNAAVWVPLLQGMHERMRVGGLVPTLSECEHNAKITGAVAAYG